MRAILFEEFPLNFLLFLVKKTEKRARQNPKSGNLAESKNSENAYVAFLFSADTKTDKSGKLGQKRSSRSNGLMSGATRQLRMRYGMRSAKACTGQLGELR